MDGDRSFRLKIGLTDDDSPMTMEQFYSAVKRVCMEVDEDPSLLGLEKGSKHRLPSLWPDWPGAVIKVPVEA